MKSQRAVDTSGGRAISTAAGRIARPDWLPHDVWPFETMRLDAHGGGIAVTDSAGPVLLFLHTGLWSFIWRDVMIQLGR